VGIESTTSESLDRDLITTSEKTNILRRQAERGKANTPVAGHYPTS